MMEPKVNYPRSSLGPVDYEKTLDEYWQSICPGKDGKDMTESQKEKKKQNPDKQIWRYSVKRKTDELKEKASVIQRCANEIKKEADLMEADDKASIRSASFWILVASFWPTRAFSLCSSAFCFAVYLQICSSGC